MNLDAPLLVIAAGGTGGHMFPAQSLAEVMLSRGWRVKLMTDARGARYSGGFPKQVEVEQLSSATFARGGALARAVVPLRIGGGVLAAVGRMMRDRPAAVVGFGGYPAIPAMAAATLLRIPRMIHEQNGVLGRVNQVFARHVDRVACGTWPTELPNGVEGVHVGNPVRAAVKECAGAPYTPPGDFPMSILVIGGSQGARILSDVVPAAIAQLPVGLLNGLRVSQQARPEDQERVTAFYAEKGIDAEVESFFQDVPQRMVQSQLVITRSGASTIADLTVIGRPAILVPLATAIRDEQSANARGMVEGGAALLMPEADFTPEALAERIENILAHPGTADAMARSALTLGKPGAAVDLADMVDGLAGRQRKDDK